MRGAAATLLALTLLAGGAPARAGDVPASPPRDRAVTVYRAPYRGSGGMVLSNLQGFALISETRVVHLPAGESRLRFEGVADGIDPATAIVTGLPSGVIEKNRDARLLSPSALIAMSVGQPVELVRRHPMTKAPERTTGRILSDAEGGVVFESAAGIEALRCSGLSETFTFDRATPGLSPEPTLSVRTRAQAPVTATVTLTYLARGFDWSADYVGELSEDGTHLNLGAWLTLANANSVAFPDAHAQVVAGRLDRRTGRVEPIDRGSAILATCWPRETTSDVATLETAALKGALTMDAPPPPPPAPPPLPIPPMARMARMAQVAQLEALGDLKLYRVPERTTVAALQSKQVRLLDRAAIPVDHIYTADLYGAGSQPARPADVVLRTKNDEAHGLDIPLPSGRIAVFQPRQGVPLLIARSNTRDLAAKEEVEWRLGSASDVQVSQVREQRTVDAADATVQPLIPGLAAIRSAPSDTGERVELGNAGAAAVAFELRLSLPAGTTLSDSDHTAGVKDGQPIFRLILPPQSTTVLRYHVGRPAIPSPSVR